MLARGWRALPAAALVVVALGACAPEEDPVRTTLPPRDADGAQLRTMNVGPESIEAHSYVRSGNISASDRLLHGSWEGLRARTFIQFDPDSFAVSAAGDTLAGSKILSASLSFNCAPGQGGEELAVTLAGVAGGEDNAWAEDSLEWPGPDLGPDQASATLENCATGDDFPEREIPVPLALIDAWIADPKANNGLALFFDDSGGRGAGGAMLQVASSENNFAFLDSVGAVSSPSGPRLRFRADLATGAGDTVSIFLGDANVSADAYVLSPDEAVLPCADPADCLLIGRGVSHRTIFRLDLPELPRGANIHQATVTLRALGHPRFDEGLDLDVFRLIDPFPGADVVDSLVVADGVLWQVATLDSAATELEIPVTDLVQAWYDEQFENEGFLVRARGEDVGVTTEAFAGPEHPSKALRPTLEIIYSEPFGGGP